MMVIGLTGGIGSGKSTVAGFFFELGIPIYIADDQAKRLTETSKVIRRKLIALLGEQTYNENGLNRTFVASKIFTDAVLLEATNQIIHPKVAQHFKRWLKKQDASYVIKEAAILFENGSYIDCDAILLITAPPDLRISRVLERDNTTVADIENRMSNQWPDERKLELADYHIENVDLAHTKEAVARLHRLLSKQSTTP